MASTLMSEMKVGKPSKPCKVGVQVATNLTVDEQADLTAAFAETTITSSTILRVLLTRGLDIGYAAVQRHRRRECGCR